MHQSIPSPLDELAGKARLGVRSVGVEPALPVDIEQILIGLEWPEWVKRLEQRLEKRPRIRSRGRSGPASDL